MKKTPFVEIHEKLGARMVEFVGFYMPLEYVGVTQEHLTVREGAGVFDVSHMGEFWIKGKKALDLVQKICSNDAAKLPQGKIQYSCFPNGKGGIVDDLLVYNYQEDKYLLVVNAGNIDKDWNWVVEQNKSVGAEIENASDHISQLAIQGPKAVEILQKLTPIDLSKIPYYTFVTGEFAGIKEVIISNTGYTGSGGFELYFYNKDAQTIWEALFEAGFPTLKPIGLAARDTLRLEMGYPLYGNDIDETTSPIEAGLGWITKFDKDFIDKDLLWQQKEKGTKRKLVGFEMIDRGIPRHDYEIADSQGNIIGKVTSGTMSPSLKIGLGMGYVATEFAALGSEIYIKIREKLVKAKTVKMPFYKNGIK